uniref:Mitochondrial antiviral-signaling protein-like n=1 Tax=Kryptolebias marmoratus TaxID=37003 RepID=A0A3Q3B0W9_KRYMA
MLAVGKSELKCIWSPKQGMRKPLSRCEQKSTEASVYRNNTFREECQSEKAIKKRKENIDAKRETNGNYDAMMVLLDCLKRRENWAEQFIEGLEACEQSALAAEMRAEYRALKGVNNSCPAPSPTTVVRAHVHPAQGASHPPITESGGNSQDAAETSPATQAPSSVENLPQQQAVEVTKAVSPPEPVPEHPVSTENKAPLRPLTPLPSPEIPHAQAAEAPQPQEMINSHQEPEINSESNIQAVPGDTSLIPAEVNSGNKEVAVNVLTPPQEHHPVSTSETGTSPSSDHTAVTTNDKPPHSPAPDQINSSGPSVSIMTPEKHPVQDTTPPVNKVPTVALLPEEMSEPAVTQLVESTPLTGHAATTSPVPYPDRMNTSHDDYETVCLSKPNQLISFQPENPASSLVQVSDSHVEPYSGTSGRLEISEASADTVTPALSCPENGITPNHNEPEENHYESPNQSMEEVLENVGHVSEMPSVPNLDGQTMVPHVQIISKRSTESMSEPPVFTNATSAPLSSLNHSHGESNNPSEPKSLQSSEKKIAPHTFPSQSHNAKYFLVAAGVSVCALLMVWKFKK